jgi:hypothetical protein
MSSCDTARSNRECARDEINERIRLRDNALLAYLGASGVVVGVALGNTADGIILLIVPYFALAASTIVAQHDATIGHLSIFLTQELEPFFQKSGEWAPSWETSKSLSCYASKAINLRTLGQTIIISIPPIFALIKLWTSGLLYPRSLQGLWWLGLTVTIIQFLILIDNHAARRRAYQSTGWTRSTGKELEFHEDELNRG